MEYEKIILELLIRVKNLEEQVAELSSGLDDNKAKQPGTRQIKNYILSLKKNAVLNGEQFLILKANDVHKALGLKSRMPAVCNAMKQSMENGDEVLYETASGFSSTYTIKYYMNEDSQNEE